MKTIAAYYFLLFYTLAMCKPILPFLQDDLAHTFWKAKHLATVHHHHGDHHAEEEVAEAEHKENDHKEAATTKNSEPVSVHIAIEILYEILQLAGPRQQFTATMSDLSTLSLDKHYPPPKCC